MDPRLLDNINEFQKPHLLNRRIILLFLAFAGTAVSIFYAVLAGTVYNYPIVSAVNILFAVWYLSTFLMLRFNKFWLSKHSLAVVFIAQTLVSQFIFFESEAYFNIYSIIALPLAFMVFSKHEVFSRFSYSCVAIVHYLVAEHTDFRVALIAPLDPMQLIMLRNINIGMAVFLMIVCIFLFIHIIEKSEVTTIKLINTDHLTGLFNRRYFYAHAQQLLEMSKRNGQTFSICFVDIDRFKDINDIHGHDTGDIVLKEVANVLLDNTRESDVVARLGGEEFIIMINNTEGKLAFAKAETIRLALEAAVMPVDNLQVSISIGISTYHETDNSIGKIIARADIAMYLAKERGRNCVVASAEFPEGFTETNLTLQ